MFSSSSEVLGFLGSWVLGFLGSWVLGFLGSWVLGSAEGDKQIGSLAGENVVISERNKKCMEVLGRQIAQGESKIGIFNGAAHFPDMEKPLEEMGFKKVSSKWLTAWRVAKH